MRQPIEMSASSIERHACSLLVNPTSKVTSSTGPLQDRFRRESIVTRMSISSLKESRSRLQKERPMGSEEGNNQFRVISHWRHIKRSCERHFEVLLRIRTSLFRLSTSCSDGITRLSHNYSCFVERRRSLRVLFMKSSPL